jgi:diaminohydroxyphosphoribosylaminopyrimidine deaminase/5-amino-6-(5-phosphoribosylamino)uracil reductase
MTAFSADDVRHMARALQLAARGLYTTDPNPRVGCVLVRDGAVVGEGWHARAGEPHAEVHALRAAGERARGATAYVSLEPCCHHGRTPPCSQALIAAGVARVVAAMPDPNPKVSRQGIAELEQAGVRVEIGLLHAEAERLNPGFIARMARGRPYVRVKLAASLDGRTALASGASQWITGAAARADVQRLRARSSAILTGVGTVLADDPSLTVRDLDIGDVPGSTSVAGGRTPGATRQPLRVVVDGHLSLSAEARLLHLPGKTLVVTAVDDDEYAEPLLAAGAEVLVLANGPDRVDLAMLLEDLAQREVNELLVEAGATLCGALLQAGLVDELVLYLAPQLLGADARGMFNIPALERMADRVALDIQDVRAVGRDWRIIARVARQ